MIWFSILKILNLGSGFFRVSFKSLVEGEICKFLSFLGIHGLDACECFFCSPFLLIVVVVLIIVGAFVLVTIVIIPIIVVVVVSSLLWAVLAYVADLVTMETSSFPHKVRAFFSGQGINGYSVNFHGIRVMLGPLSIVPVLVPSEGIIVSFESGVGLSEGVSHPEVSFILDSFLVPPFNCFRNSFSIEDSVCELWVKGFSEHSN